MGLNIPQEQSVQNLMVSQFGMNNTIAYHLKKAKEAGNRFNVALTDKNALNAAKEGRDLIANVESAYAILDRETSSKIDKEVVDK